MAVNYTPTDPVAGQSRSTGTTEVQRWVDYADTIGDVDTRLDAIEAVDYATQTELDAHINDASDAHDASAISFTPTGSIAATDVQAAIAEVASEAASAGGGIDHKVARRSSSDITLNSSSWANVDTGLDLTLTGVAVGDVIQASISGRTSNQANEVHIDAVTLVAGSPVNAFATGAAAPTSTTGEGSWYAPASTYHPFNGSTWYTLQSGDIHTTDQVTIRWRYRGSTRTLLANSNRNLIVQVQNLGAVQA